MNGNGEKIWRWAVRILGAIGFIVMLIVFAIGREVSVAWLLLIGSMVGLEPIIDWQRRSNGND